jgi:hypothetical protein
MVAALLLAAGGARLLMREQDRTRGLLMVTAALVLVGNVLIWVWPISVSR